MKSQQVRHLDIKQEDVRVNELIVDIIFPSATLFASLVAIWISLRTLKINNKMLEESSRPYIIVYSTITNYSFPSYRIIVKNFGSSAASIKKFNYSKNLIPFIHDSDNRNPFDKLNGLTLAPNQKIIINLEPNKIQALPDKSDVEFKFDIIYESTIGNEYRETYTDKIYNKEDILSFRPKSSSEKESLDIISHALQEISDNRL